MQRRYKRRRDRVLAAVRRELPAWTIGGAAAGLHLTLIHPASPDPRRLVAAARDARTRIVPLAEYRMHAGALDAAIVLGYGNISDNEVGPAIRALATAVESLSEG
jgi:GntR family transcriptional regulator/MocR family aminotransferase